MKYFLHLCCALLLLGGWFWLLHVPPAGVAALGPLFDPLDGLYRTARQADHEPVASVDIPNLGAPVTIVRDERGVPHIFAGSDRDAVMALGYVVAQDRLFQLDFIPRVASGRLASAMGPGAVRSDRFLRRTGMEWGSQKNLARIVAQGGLEYELLSWYAAGVNAYLDKLDDADLPFEFRLLGYKPDRFSVLQGIRLLQYMTYDLTYRNNASVYAALEAALGTPAYQKLYPRNSFLYVPIIPPSNAMSGGVSGSNPEAAFMKGEEGGGSTAFEPGSLGFPIEGFIEGKGSNNWAVDGRHATTGAPILAGDMHLSLSLPAIWYEVHIVTPSMNTYGVTIPGAPLPIEAFNNHLGWAFTNTGADQIDHLALELDDTGSRYRYEDGFRELEQVPDTINVKWGDPVVDTLLYSHWGPVTRGPEGAIALHWVAHDSSRTMQAIWGMNQAKNQADFEEALTRWDTPMQNILYADTEGNISIRSTGHLPIRKAGHGMGLIDGRTDAYSWIGRVPFEALPHAANPEQGYLSSTNQQPADASYPYYLGHNWGSFYRSLRIDTLLRSKPLHSVDDLKRYQSDVVSMQNILFSPLLDTLSGLSPRADTLRLMLTNWDGATTVDRAEPLILDHFLEILTRLTWDEDAFKDHMAPRENVLYRLLTTEPQALWLDRVDTPSQEDAATLLRHALEQTATALTDRSGWEPSTWRWGDHHKVVFRHLTQSEGLAALWRGPFEYPGFASTLSPASGRMTTHSASWRVVVDFSTTPPTGYGVYPGGQSGNPFSSLYDAHLPAYLTFQHYSLYKPEGLEAVDSERVTTQLTLIPGN